MGKKGSVAMSEIKTFDAPVIPAFSPTDKFQREKHAFFQLLPELLKTHRGKYVAIHNGEVVETGDDQIQVARQAFVKHGYVPICVKLVTDAPPPVFRCPSIRVIEDRPR
jgi:Family of unknown function (DUF5678)